MAVVIAAKPLVADSFWKNHACSEYGRQELEWEVNSVCKCIHMEKV
jgi:hypothetical protein